MRPKQAVWMVLACAAAAQAPLPGQVEPGVGRVEGRVTHSLTGMPISKVQVRVTGDVPRPGRVEPDRVSYATETDSAGRFEVTGLREGQYGIQIEKPGFQMDRKKTSGIGGFRLTPQVTEVKSTYELSPLGLITGRVLDANGEPAENVQVMALRKRYHWGRRQWAGSGSAVTDDRGEFRMWDAQPGQVILAANPRPWLSNIGPRIELRAGGGDTGSRYEITLYPSALEPEGAEAVEVTAGGHVQDVVIRMRKEPTFSLKGKVVDKRAGEGQRFVVGLRERREILEWGSEQIQTEEDGSFEFKHKLRGRYVLSARLPDTPEPRKGQRVGFVDIDLTKDIENVVLELKPAFGVRGTVEVRGADASKVDLTKFSVWLEQATEGFSILAPGLVTVNADGSWSFDDVLPGHYRLRCFANWMRGVNPHQVSGKVNGQEWQGRENLLTEETLGPIEFVFSTDSATIGGTVEGGRAGLNERSMAIAISTDEAQRRAEFWRQGSMDEKGAFKIDGLKPGEYLVFVFNDFDYGVLEDPDVLKRITPKAVRVKAVANEEARVQVKVTDWPETRIHP